MELCWGEEGSVKFYFISWILTVATGNAQQGEKF